MASDNDKDKKGFSGLSDLVSEINGIDEPVSSEPITEVKPSSDTQTSSQTPRRTSQPKRESTTSPPPIETISSGKSSVGSVGKWILGIIAVIFIIWLVNNGGQSKKPPVETSNSFNKEVSQLIAYTITMNSKLEEKELEKSKNYEEKGIVLLLMAWGKNHFSKEKGKTFDDQVNYKAEKMRFISTDDLYLEYENKINDFFNKHKKLFVRAKTIVAKHANEEKETK